MPKSINNKYLPFLLLFIFVSLDLIIFFHGKILYFSDTIVLPVLIITAALMKRFKLFINDWCLYLSAIYLFDALRTLIYMAVLNFTLPLYGSYIIKFDEFLLGGLTFPQYLDVFFQTAFLSRGAEYFATFFYGMHFLYFIIFALIIWYYKPTSFGRYKVAAIFTLLAGAFLYLMFPTIPPWYAVHCGLLPSLHEAGAANLYNVYVPSLVQRFGGNPVASMPSLHVAFPALGMFILFDEFGWWGILGLLYLCADIFSVGYLGDHYLGDVLAGIALALVSYLVFYKYRGWLNHSVIKKVHYLINYSLKSRVLLAVVIMLFVQLVYSGFASYLKTQWHNVASGQIIKYNICPQTKKGH